MGLYRCACVCPPLCLRVSYGKRNFFTLHAGGQRAFSCHCLTNTLLVGCDIFEGRLENVPAECTAWFTVWSWLLCWVSAREYDLNSSRFVFCLHQILNCHWHAWHLPTSIRSPYTVYSSTTSRYRDYSSSYKDYSTDAGSCFRGEPLHPKFDHRDVHHLVQNPDDSRSPARHPSNWSDQGVWDDPTEPADTSVFFNDFPSHDLARGPDVLTDKVFSRNQRHLHKQNFENGAGIRPKLKFLSWLPCRNMLPNSRSSMSHSRSPQVTGASKIQSRAVWARRRTWSSTSSQLVLVAPNPWIFKTCHGQIPTAHASALGGIEKILRSNAVKPSRLHFSKSSSWFGLGAGFPDTINMTSLKWHGSFTKRGTSQSNVPMWARKCIRHTVARAARTDTLAINGIAWSPWPIPPRQGSLKQTDQLADVQEFLERILAPTHGRHLYNSFWSDFWTSCKAECLAPNFFDQTLLPA